MTRTVGCATRLFKAIYVDEDNDVRVGYQTPYDWLSIEGLQADALTWAAEAVGPGPNFDRGRSLGRKFKPDPFGVGNRT